MAPKKSSLRLFVAGAVLALAATAHPALAQDIGTVATNTSGTFNAIAKALTAASGLGGIFMMIAGARDLVTATTQGTRGDVKHSHALIKIVVAAMLFSLAIGINVMKTTLFNGASNSTITPSTIQVN